MEQQRSRYSSHEDGERNAASGVPGVPPIPSFHRLTRPIPEDPARKRLPTLANSGFDPRSHSLFYTKIKGGEEWLLQKAKHVKKD
jgi:hypothetical protein